MTQIKENITPEFFTHGEQKYRTTPPTKEEEAQWKTTFGEVLVADDGEGQKLWLRRPDLPIMRVAIAQFRKGKTTIDFEDLLFKSCWLAGGEDWLTNEDLYEAALNEFEPWVEIPDAETRFLADENLYELKVKNFVCKVTKPSRKQRKQAEKRNTANKPFGTEMNLLEMIWQEGDLDELRQDDFAYMGVLAATQELKTQKIVELVKK
jgi:hypothetical protein